MITVTNIFSEVCGLPIDRGERVLWFLCHVICLRVMRVSESPSPWNELLITAFEDMEGIFFLFMH